MTTGRDIEMSVSFGADGGGLRFEFFGTDLLQDVNGSHSDIK